MHIVLYGCLAERLLQRAADGKTSEAVAVAVSAEDLKAELQDFGDFERIAGEVEENIADMEDAESLERRLVTARVELMIALK